MKRERGRGWIESREQGGGKVGKRVEGGRREEW